MLKLKRKIQYYIYSILVVIKSYLYTIYNNLKLRYWGVEIGTSVSMYGIINVINMNKITIGRNVRLISGYGNFVGGSERISFQTGQSGEIRIGENTGISNTTIISQSSIIIGADVFIGGGTKIYDNDFHPITSYDRKHNPTQIPTAPIHIKSGAFIGGHCVILKGVTIGHGAVVGAGSVVTRDIPDEEVWAGVPARFIKKL